MLIRKHPCRHTEGCPCTQVIFKTCKASLLLWLLFLLQCRFVLTWSNFNATDIPKLYFLDGDCVFVSSKCLIPCYIGPQNSETWRYDHFGFYLCKLSKYFEDVALSMNGAGRQNIKPETHRQYRWYFDQDLLYYDWTVLHKGTCKPVVENCCFRIRFYHQSQYLNLQKDGLHHLYFPEISASAFGLTEPASLSRAINSLHWHDRSASYAKKMETKCLDTMHKIPYLAHDM